MRHRIAILILALTIQLACLRDEGGTVQPGAWLTSSAVALDGGAGNPIPVTSNTSLLFVGSANALWTATWSATWLTVTPDSGTLLPNGMADITVSCDASLLAVGTYTDTVSIQLTGGVVTTLLLDVTFNVANNLRFTPSTLTLDAEQGDTTPLSDTLQLVCSGTSSVTWTAASDATWLVPSPTAGTLSGGASTVDITVTPESGFATGWHTGTVTATDTSGVLPDATLQVSLYVRTPQDDSAFSVSERTVHLYAQTGDATSTAVALSVGMVGGSSVPWTATQADSWLLLDGATSAASGTLSDGESAAVTVSADTGALSAGVHASTIICASSGAVPRDIVVTVALVIRSAASSSTMAYFVSDIDGSQQKYGLYVPTSYTRGVDAPVVLILHGWGGSASESFDASVTSRANTNGWILVKPDGRGWHQYDSASSTDLFEVLDDLDGAYGIDRTRIFSEGGSMGATGSFRHLARHPDVFTGAGGVDGWTDFRLWHKQWYSPQGYGWEIHPTFESGLEQAAPLTHAENIRPDSVYIVSNTGDLEVYSEGDPKLSARLTRLGSTHTFVSQAGGHTNGYSTHEPLMHDYFKNVVAPLDPDPDSVFITSNRLRTAKNAWLQVERFGWDCFARLEQPYRPDQGAGYGTDRAYGFNTPATIEVDRAVASGTCTFTVDAGKTRNVERFTIRSAPVADDYVVEVGAVTVASFAQGAETFPLTVELVLDGTGAFESGSIYTGTPSSPAKTPQVEGPVDRAICARFVVAYGSADASQTTTNQAGAQEFCNAWNDSSYGFRATIAPVDEVTLTPSDIASSNLLLFGSEESSTLIARMADDPVLPFNLPARILNDSITIGENVFGSGDIEFDGSAYGIWMAYPNPLAPDRLVVIGNNVVGGTAGLTGAIFWTADAYHWKWPDYVVFKTDEMPRVEVDNPYYSPDQHVLAGHFDRDWMLPDSSTPITDVTVATSAPTYTTGTLTAPIRVEVYDELGSFVGGLTGDAFDVRVDGEVRSVTFTEVVIPAPADHYYTADLPILDLDITDGGIAPLNIVGFDLTVEIVRRSGTLLVGGRGRTRFEITQ